MKTFERGFELLEHIVQANDPVTISDLTAHSGLDRSTVYRYLNVLQRHGLVKASNNPDHGYIAGTRILELSSYILRRLTIRDQARPHMIGLAQQVGLTVHLGTLDNHQVLYLEKVETQDSLPTISRVGSKANLHSTALGKVLLAFEDSELADQCIRAIVFKQKTPKTITSPDKFKEELFQIRRQGYAFDKEENEEGIQCIAAPLWGHTGRIVAAISLSGLVRQYKNQSQIISELLRASSEISLALGARTSRIRAKIPDVIRR